MGINTDSRLTIHKCKNKFVTMKCFILDLKSVPLNYGHLWNLSEDHKVSAILEETFS